MTIIMTTKTTSEDYQNSNHLVLNFYPDGYTIAIKLNEFPVFTSETILETAKISYEETSLLDYIENEELPPLLVEMIDASPKLSQYKIWHNGCLILEIRDKISTTNNKDDNPLNDPFNLDINTEQLDHNYHHHNSNNLRPELKLNNYLSTQTTNNLTNTHLGVDLNDRIPDMNNIDMIDDNINIDDININGQDCLTDFDKFLHHENSESIDIPGIQSQEERTNTESNFNQSLFILLKPTNLSMLNDVQNLTDSELWSNHDRLQLESKIILHSYPSLSLEPKVVDKQENEGALDDEQGFTRRNSWPYRKPINAFTRLKKKLPNGCRRRSNDPTERSQCPIAEDLPPELSLQQFLATKRTKKRLLPSQMPKFHRFCYSRKINKF